MMTTMQMQEQTGGCSSRKELLEQAFDVIMKLNDSQLKCLMERVGYVERKAV